MAMGDESFRMRLKFWGVRGSTPTPQRENLGFGGNTPCLEVRLPDGEIFILDGGTGIRSLGLSLMEEFPDSGLKLNVFLTHFHWDHIQGIPFFAPLYEEQNEVTFSSFSNSGGPEKMLRGQMQRPYFPVDLDRAPARRHFREIEKEPQRFGPLQILPFPLNHPQGAQGYRLECREAVIVYATDCEHGDPRLDRTVREFSQNADILIYDAQYTPGEYSEKQGWGHSTWLEATRVAREAKVKQLVLFHHHPGRSDDAMSQVVEEARLHYPNTIAAQEGWTVDL